MSDDRTVLRQTPDVTVFRLLDTSAAGPCLILYSGEDAGRRFDLGPGSNLIGRSPEATVQINLPGISRRHAEVEVRGGVVVVRDLGSANRTCVNEVPVDGPVPLKQGDLIQVDNVILRFHDHKSLDALLHDRIYRLAMTDAGTGTYNRRYLADALEREVHRAHRGGHPFSVACFDLDHFKQVNDRYGHAAGDRVLRECARRVQDGLRGADVLCRSGGEEFVVLLPDTDAAAAALLAERLRAAVAGMPFVLSASTGDITAAANATSVLHRQTISLGVAELAEDLADGAALLDLADRRLYAAKHGGRNRVVAEGS